MDSSKSSKSTKSAKSSKSTKSTKSSNSTHLFAKYGGKACRSKGSSKSSSDSEKADEIDDSKIENNDEKRVNDGENDPNDEEVDEENGEEYRKGSSKKHNIDAIELAGIGGGGADSEEEEGDEDDEDRATKGSDEKYALHENEDGEAGVNGEDGAATGDDESKESGEDIQDDAYDTEMAGEDTEADETAEGKKRKKVKSVMEYDVQDMYPEINILIQKKKREWDFQDPDIMRALWLETKTLALAEWKVRNAKIKIDKPSIEARDNMTTNLRQMFLKHEAELKKVFEERDFEMTASRDPPHFDAMQLATNLTTDMRYKYNRNNPPVPSHYIEHFEKFKKPPFKNNPFPVKTVSSDKEKR